MAHGGRRNADDALAAALACGATAEQAAAKAGVSVRTAHRRLADPGFRDRVAGVRRDAVGRTAALLTAAAGEAVRTLLGLQKEAVKPAVRLGAARAVLELGVKYRELADLEVELRSLEEKVRGLEGRGGVGAWAAG